MTLRHPIKIIIQKSRPVGRDWQRFRSIDKIILTNNSSIKHESDLCKFIYRKFGEGRYMLLAFQKKYKGFWCYWIGTIYSNGYVRETRKNKELEKIKQNYTGDDFEDFENEKQFAKEMFELDKSLKRYGPIGITKLRPGIMHGFNEKPKKRK